MKVFSLIIIIFNLSINAQINAPIDPDKEPQNSFEYTQKVKKSLEDLKGLVGKDYYQKVDQYRALLEKYMDHKKRVCEGEFSTVILLEENESSKNKPPSKSNNKLSKDERKLCYRELKALQVTFIDNMFHARKNYLNYLHEEQLKALEDAREKSIKNIQSSFTR